MEERWLLACTHYIEYNPVRPGLAKFPEDWKWSSAGAHVWIKRMRFLSKQPPCLRLSISPGEIFYFLIFINLKLNYSENMNGPTDRSNDFCKTFGSYFRQAAEAQKKLVEITMSKVSPDLVRIWCPRIKVICAGYLIDYCNLAQGMFNHSKSGDLQKELCTSG